MQEINILITSAGSAPAISVIKALRKQKEIQIKIIAVDMGELSAGFFLADKSYLVPPSQRPDFIPEIKRICKKEEVSILIPIIDEELPIFAKEKNSFSSLGLKVLVNDFGIVERGNDKYKTYLFCKENGVLTPTTYLYPGNKGQVFNFPIIVKPRFGRGSQSLYKVEDQDQLQNLPLNDGEFILQEFIPGKEFTVDIFARPDGVVLQVVPRERIMVKAGQIYKGRTVKRVNLIELAKGVAEKFGINGPCNIQFIERNNRFYLIEVNPKFAAGLPLTVNAGVNIPLLLIKIHLGIKVSSQELEFRDNFYMLRYWEEVYFSK